MNKKLTVLLVLLSLSGAVLLTASFIKNKEGDQSNSHLSNTFIEENLMVEKIENDKVYITGEGNAYKIYENEIFSIEYTPSLEVFENTGSDITSVVFVNNGNSMASIQVHYGKDITKLSDSEIVNKRSVVYATTTFIVGDGTSSFSKKKYYWTQGKNFALSIVVEPREKPPYDMGVDFRSLILK